MKYIYATLAISISAIVIIACSFPPTTVGGGLPAISTTSSTLGSPNQRSGAEGDVEGYNAIWCPATNAAYIVGSSDDDGETAMQRDKGKYKMIGNNGKVVLSRDS